MNNHIQVKRTIYLVEKLHGTDLHSVHNEGEKGPFQAGTENTGVLPHNLVGSL